MGRYKGIERRAADRIKDCSSLKVIGVTKSGQAFEEITQARDVSPDGILFSLKTSIEPGGVVELSICADEAPGREPLPRFQTKARVLRVCREVNENLFLIAARFEGDVAELADDGGLERLVEELQRAVEYDESRRE